MTAEQKLEQNIITVQMSNFLMTQQTIYLASLQQIHDAIRSPPRLDFIQHLATNPNFCSAFACFKKTTFQLKDRTLKITTQKYSISLQTQALLTCSLLHGNRVSIYHNMQCSITEKFYHPNDKRLSPLPISLLEGEKQNIPRKTDSADLLKDNIIVLFNKNQQAFQCLTPTHLIIDGKDTLCTNQTLQWGDKPNTVVLKETGERILEHVNFKSTHITWNLQTPSPTRDISNLLLKPFNQTLLHDVKHFFKSVDKHHMAIFGSVIFAILTCFCVPVCCCYYCSSFLKALTKRCLNWNTGRLAMHHQSVKERKKFKKLMKHMDKPIAKASAPLLPNSSEEPTNQEIRVFMETNRAKLIQLENLLNVKLAAEQEEHAHCPPPSAPPAPELQLHLSGASEQ